MEILKGQLERLQQRVELYKALLKRQNERWEEIAPNNVEIPQGDPGFLVNLGKKRQKNKLTTQRLELRSSKAGDKEREIQALMELLEQGVITDSEVEALFRKQVTSTKQKPSSSPQIVPIIETLTIVQEQLQVPQDEEQARVVEGIKAWSNELPQSKRSELKKKAVAYIMQATPQTHEIKNQVFKDIADSNMYSILKELMEELAKHGVEINKTTPEDNKKTKKYSVRKTQEKIETKKETITSATPVRLQESPTLRPIIEVDKIDQEKYPTITTQEAELIDIALQKHNDRIQQLCDKKDKIAEIARMRREREENNRNKPLSDSQRQLYRRRRAILDKLRIWAKGITDKSSYYQYHDELTKLDNDVAAVILNYGLKTDPSTGVTHEMIVEILAGNGI